jgi:hypothetical protein
MRSAVTAVAMIALGLAACGGSERPEQPAPVPEVSVTVLQQRVDEATRMVGVEATNRGAAPVHVSSVRLSGGGLDSARTPLDTDLQPGLTVALRTSYGRPVCDDRTGRSTPTGRRRSSVCSRPTVRTRPWRTPQQSGSPGRTAWAPARSRACAAGW